MQPSSALLPAPAAHSQAAHKICNGKQGCTTPEKAYTSNQVSMLVHYMSYTARLVDNTFIQMMIFSYAHCMSGLSLQTARSCRNHAVQHAAVSMLALFMTIHVCFLEYAVTEQLHQLTSSTDFVKRLHRMSANSVATVISQRVLQSECFKVSDLCLHILCSRQWAS